LSASAAPAAPVRRRRHTARAGPPRLLAAALVLVPVLAGCQRAPAAPVADRIVFVLIDTLRRDYLSIYGGPVETPHLDGLARRGQALDHALSAYHMTSMSMATLFTGRTPSLDVRGERSALPWDEGSWCGLARLASGPDDTCIPRSVATLGERLHDAGYATFGVASNAMLHGGAGFSRGFDVWREVGRVDEVPEQGRAALARHGPATRTAARVLAATRALLASRSGDHFFLYVHLMDVHDYASFPSEEDPKAWGRALRAMYARAVAREYAAVGELLAIFDAQGLRDGTTFVITSDHGEHLGEPHPQPPRLGHGGNPSYDTLVRVPLIVSPARVPEPSPPLHGRDVHALLLGAAGLVPTPADGEPDWRAGELYTSELEWRTHRGERWKWMQERASGRELLFDLAADPGETRDMRGAFPERAADIRRRVARISAALAAAPRAPRALRPGQLDRLRALGYAE